MLLITFFGLELLIACASFGFYGFELAALQSVLRWSGRLSLLLFAWGMLSWSRKRWNPQWLVLFAFVHGIHGFEVVTYLVIGPMEFVWHRLIGGIAGYVLVLVVPCLRAVQRFRHGLENGTSWWLTLFFYYLWLIFFMTYLARIRGKLTGITGDLLSFQLAFLAVVGILIVHGGVLWLSSKQGGARDDG